MQPVVNNDINCKGLQAGRHFEVAYAACIGLITAVGPYFVFGDLFVYVNSHDISMRAVISPHAPAVATYFAKARLTNAKGQTFDLRSVGEYDSRNSRFCDASSNDR
jgi:hypothetical protein